MSPATPAAARQARVELATTAVRPAVAVALLVLVGLPLLLVTAARLAGPEGGRELVEPWAGLGSELATTPGPVAANRVLQRRIAAFDARLEESSPWLEVAQPTIQGALLRWGGVGNEEVVAGESDRAGERWLHFRPGIELLTGPGFLDPGILARRRLATPAWEPPLAADPRPAIHDFAAQLQRRGIALVFLPVPPKTAILPATFGARGVVPGTPRNPSLAPLLAELEAAGIGVVDPTGRLVALARAGVTPYLRTDSHWSPAAVDAVARDLAAELVARGIEPGVRRTPSGATAIRGTGDLARLLRLPSWAAPAPETVHPPRPGEAPPGGSPVLLVGDSFSNVYARRDLGWGRGAGLGERLAHHLGRAVDVVARNDGGATGSRRALAAALAGGDDLLAGKRVVVWQVAARELARGDWQRIEIPQVAAPRAAAHPAEAPTTVEATVASVATTPAPASTPYRDLLVAVHLVDVRAKAPRPAGKSFADGAIVMYTWGLRDGEPAPGARLAPGRRVVVDLVPWRQVAADLESLERRELPDPDLLLLEPWFTDDVTFAP